MAEKTEAALGGMAAPKAEEPKSAGKTYETPLKEAYEAGDLPTPESAVSRNGNGSGVRPADPNGPEERIARLRRQSAWLAAAFVFLFVFMMVVWMNDASRAVIFWMWAVGTVGIFILSVRLWLALVREDEKKAKRIRDRDVRYRKTLALLPEGVAILGEGWRIDWVNARGAEHFGIAPEMIGRSFFDVVTDERLRHWLFERNFAGRCNYTSKAGLDLDVSVVAPDSRHMMIVTHDVTERLRIDEMRRDFVANVSHELRTPLTVISGFLDIESQGKVPANVMQKHRELMLDQARRMQSLLDDLLLLSGLENRDETDSDDAEVISMTKLLEDVVNEGRALSLGRHVITLEACRASLVGEPSDIRSAAMNLVSNAVRYTPEGGRIDVRWLRTSSGAVLSVKDTGIGIEEKHIPRLTERFYRVDKGRSRSTGGTGLGLAIVKHVCRSAGGQLKIESTPGKGSTFSMVFPKSRIFDDESV